MNNDYIYIDEEELLGSILEDNEELNGSLNVASDSIQGPTGEPGKSAYEIAIRNGFVGTEEEWLLSLKGEKGDTGAQGDIGAKGDNGDKGDKGDVGIAGPANILSIGIVEDGINASATITGNSPSQILNLVLPKGEKGDKGDKGDQGLQGVQGLKGDKGDNGNKGDQGIQGVSGYTPIKNIDYFDGKDGVNGKDGYTPIKNVDYFDGKDGKSAYQTWLDSGNTGTEIDFINSLKGEKGNVGERGANGTDGIDGKDGSDGKDGYTPYIENDYWYINGVSTGVKASGEGGTSGGGEAGSITIVDSGNHYTSADVEGALQELALKIGDIAAALDAINGEVI